ncbi:MAG: hypothetical protein IKL06_00850, partial [Lachnospiraceae bacterium]|nr:hypothetical protein [Lachnospiraceae bacterium]
MRITNNMMLKTTMSNIYGNKENVNTLNNQMASQKKISRPSEDPVVAIRALRLRSNLSEIDQYYEKNIPDAEAWLDVTETALKNMESILSDVRTPLMEPGKPGGDFSVAEDMGIFSLAAQKPAQG